MDCIIETLPRSNIRILFEEIAFIFLSMKIQQTQPVVEACVYLLNFKHLTEKNSS